MNNIIISDNNPTNCKYELKSCKEHLEFIILLSSIIIYYIYYYKKYWNEGKERRIGATDKYLLGLLILI